MRKVNNIIYPEQHNLLKTPYGYMSQVVLGESKAYVNDKLTTIVFNESDVIEVKPVRIDDNIYYIESKSYSAILSELVHIKYTIDDEMALSANYRINPNSQKEQEYQEWRSRCKKIAKQLVNE